jgi:carboxymethylenebutenolidase
VAQTVMLETSDGPMATYDAEPSGAARAGVVVLQDAFGVSDYLESVCRELADEGYRAIAPHLYHRSGDPVLDYGPAESTMPYFQALAKQGLVDDLDASVAYLARVGFDPVHTAVIGFCQGGTVAFLAATHYSLGAAITFYGGGIADGRFRMDPLLELAAGIRTPWLGLYGDKDLPSDHGAGIPVADVEALRRAAANAPVPTQIVRYAEAGHAFHCWPRPELYHEPSARDAWQRTLDWLTTHVGANG